MISQKGLNDFLKEDESLKRKITYDEFNSSERGLDDKEIENVYQNYREIIDGNQVS